jgi:hypothetical protein
MHERARLLIDESRIQPIATDDALWLRRHLAECPDCALHEEATQGVLRGIQGFAFDLDVRPAFAPAPRKAHWAAIAAGVLLVAAAVPLFRTPSKPAEDLLFEEVENRISRTVPRAMQPLVRMQPEASQ